MPNDPHDADKPHIPKPPTPAETDQVSREQGMITDEWTDDKPGAKPAGTPQQKP